MYELNVVGKKKAKANSFEAPSLSGEPTTLHPQRKEGEKCDSSPATWPPSNWKAVVSINCWENVSSCQEPPLFTLLNYFCSSHTSVFLCLSSRRHEQRTSDVSFLVQPHGQNNSLDLLSWTKRPHNQLQRQITSAEKFTENTALIFGRQSTERWGLDIDVWLIINRSVQVNTRAPSNLQSWWYSLWKECFYFLARVSEEELQRYDY